MTNSIYDRWGVAQSDEEGWEIFINRLRMILAGSSTIQEMPESDVQRIAFDLGRPFKEVASTNNFDGTTYLRVHDLINKYKTPLEVAIILEAILKVLTDGKARLVKTLVERSNCGFKLIRTKNEWVTYPPGEKILDEKLVEEPLVFLTGNPAVQFKKSLEDYTNSKFVESAEKTRRALEEYFRQLYVSPRLGLSAGIKKYETELKQAGVPAHVRAIISRQLRILDSHYNDSSKHQSETKPYEAEFLIYAVGLLFRVMEEIRNSRQAEEG